MPSRMDHLLDVLGLCVVVALIVLGPTQYSVEVAPKTYLSLVDPVVWLGFVVWVIRVARKQERMVVRPPLLVVLLLGCMALSVVRATDRVAGLKDLFQYTEYFVVAFLLFGSSFQAEARRRRLTLLFLSVGIAVVAWAAVHYCIAAVPALKVRGPFGNRNVYGGFLCLLLPLALGLLVHDRQPVRRVAWGTVLLAGLITNLSGGALLGLLIGGAVVLGMRGERALLTGMAVTAGLFFLVFPQLPRPNGEILYDSVRMVGDDNVLSPRYVQWQAAWIMMDERPGLGVGAGNYQQNIGSYYGSLPSPVMVQEHDSQNLYLVLGSSIGFIGMAAFAGTLIVLIVRAVGRAARMADGWDKGLMLGAAGSLVAYGIACLWSPLLVRGIGIPLAFMLALVSSLARCGNACPAE